MEGRAVIESIHKRIGHILVSYKYYVLVWSGFVNEKTNRTVRSTYCPTDIVWFYNCLNGMWTSKQTTGDIPQKTSGSSAAVSDDFLYIFAGMVEFTNNNTQRHRNDLYRLHLPSLTWEKLSPLGPKPPHSDKGVAWAFDGKLYFYGGYGPRPDPSTMDYVFQADITNTNGRMGWNSNFFAYDPIGNKWFKPSTRGRTPDPRAAHSASIVGNRAFIFGGRLGEARTNDVYCINLDTLTWSQNINAPSKDTGPEGRSWLSFNFVSRKKAVVYGGLRQYGIPAMDYWECEFSDNYESLTWTKCVSPIEPRIWHQAAFCETTHELVIVGGVNRSPYDMEEEFSLKAAIILKYYHPESIPRSINDAKLDFNTASVGITETPNSCDNPPISDVSETLPASHRQMNPTGDHDASRVEGTPSGPCVIPPFSFGHEVPTEQLVNRITVPSVYPKLSVETRNLRPSDAVYRNHYTPHKKSPFKCSTRIKTPEVSSFKSYITPDNSPCKNSKSIYPSLEGISFMSNDALETPRSPKPRISVTMWSSATEGCPSNPDFQNIVLEPCSTDDSEYCETPSEMPTTPMSKSEKMDIYANVAKDTIKMMIPNVANIINVVQSAGGGVVGVLGAIASTAASGVQIASAAKNAYARVKPLRKSPSKPDSSDLKDQIATLASTVSWAAQIATASLDAYEEIKPQKSPNKLCL